MNICFVCYGNTCRSPMAKYILRYLLKKENINDVNVTSAGTNVYSVRLMSSGSQEQLKLHNIPFDTHYSQLFTDKLYNNNDLIIVMDNSNLLNIQQYIPNANKVKLMRSFFDGNYDIYDPYHTDKYNVAFDQIYNSCLGLIQYLKRKEKNNEK